MRTSYIVVLLLVANISLILAASGKIKHIIVLMEENRSFDHMFGFFEGVNGLNGSEYNLVNVSNSKSERIYVDDKAPFVALCDPDHSTPATTFKIFGSTSDAGEPLMNGFVSYEEGRGNTNTNGCAVMSSQAPSHLPIMGTLASEFVLMDRFFCAHAGPTWPNRLYMLSGTSAGSTETGVYYQNKPGALFPQPTIFDQLMANNLTWRNYYNDTPWELFLETIATNPENHVNMEQFYEDARTGNLPSFGWINPRAGINVTLNQGSNDQHPDHDVALGERYYKDIYEALRASPAWNETLYIITYDEHGGFADHIPTPLNVPPPDSDTSYPDAGVLFNRLGIRIPTLLISPWLPKGLVVSGPTSSQKPAANSEFTLTSIMATARILLGMPTTPLTKRDAWSATFEDLFDTLNAPRTDCPMHLPAAPPPANITEEDLPVNGLQKEIMEMHANLAGVPFPTHIVRQGQVSEWLQEHYAAHVRNTEMWKRSKHARTHTVGVVSQRHSATISQGMWTVNKDESGYFLLSSDNVCLDHAQGIAGVSRCFPHTRASASLDKNQQWVWCGDAAICPKADALMCLSRIGGNNRIELRACREGARNQEWIYENGKLLSEGLDSLKIIPYVSV